MDYMVSGLRFDRCICKTLSKSWIWERNQKHHSLLERFYKLFYWSKKRISKHLLDNMIPNNRYSCSDYMVLFFGYMNRVKNRQLDETKTGLRPDRLICKTLSKSWIWERNQKHLSLLETFYKLFYWIKERTKTWLHCWGRGHRRTVGSLKMR